ncbi:MAG TPA: uroporphyrinogen-III C-methyltransferase [Jatrophihabitans sp.]|jgi:uroporphyrin-III C-methyltransferase/precorrin-2 dehydrogenase/sirohydrochlorin ferrochelatase
MSHYPLLLDLVGRHVLVVGGGTVATRRTRSLVEAGAAVHVVAPEVTDELRALAPALVGRAFVTEDVDGAWLVVAATDDPAVNEAVASAAEERRIFCIRADLAEGGTARTPAVLRKDELTVAINAGDDPRRAAALRDAISLALDLGELPARRHRPAARGSVVLVGGGPGDPELISVRGRRLVADADVIVVDRLAPRALLEEIPDGVEVIDSGKAAHRHNLTQQQINDLLVEKAREGKRVVRLKGGDPFVFGRGGEEWLACVAAGVPVTVVPGITSALAGPAMAGIPVTHRGVAADFTVVSGHLDPGRPAEEVIDWPRFAAARGDGGSGAAGEGTLVILMGMDRLAAIADELIKYGRPASTPTAVVHRATLPGQRVVRGRLDEIAEAALREGVGAPAVIVVGDVVDVLHNLQG